MKPGSRMVSHTVKLKKGPCSGILAIILSICYTSIATQTYKNTAISVQMQAMMAIDSEPLLIMNTNFVGIP